MTDAPPFINEFEDLLRTVQQVLADREAAYPRLVAEKKLTSDDSDAGLRIMRAIVADWQRIVDLRADRAALPLDATATDFEKSGTLSQVLQRIEARTTAAWTPLRAKLDDIGQLKAVLSSITARPQLEAIVAENKRGWPCIEIELFLAAEHRFRLCTALVWHAERWPAAMILAEIQAELAARYRPAVAA